MRWLLYLGTNNGVTALAVGVAGGSSIAADDPFPPAPPLMWYGTSIIQGGVSFKPGSIATARISRALAREVLNFGFSAQCKMEQSVAAYLVNASSASSGLAPALIVIDCLWNMQPAEIASAAAPLVAFIRAHGHATTPIVLAEGTAFGRNWAVAPQAAFQNASNAALRGAFEALVAAGDENLYYVRTEQIWAPGGDSPTAAGLHPTDEGMHRQASFWAAYLPPLLQPRATS